MDEQKRLRTLKDYQILDTPQDQYLDELTHIASAICDTKIALISLVARDRQWFKSVQGLKVKETSRESSFCQYAIPEPYKTLVVNDSMLDDRFKENPLVTGDPNIRFYAGAPLTTPDGDVLGTLCVLDDKPQALSPTKEKALGILAKKAMKYMADQKLLNEQRKHIKNSAEKLKKLTNKAPGIIFQFEMDAAGNSYFPFISEGVKELHPTINSEDLKNSINPVFELIYEEDLDYVKKKIEEAFLQKSMMDFAYRVKGDDDRIIWHQCKTSDPEILKNGVCIWYGVIYDITIEKEYKALLKQILFDISHVIRRPVSTMLGLTDLIESENLDEETLRTYAESFKVISKELDDFTRELNQSYRDKSPYHEGN
ncbi:GAF domain-containing protein [Psychroflexus sp. CAK57W]|uniref:GAF domain-containing protein n=1 Tax=Psychroflexus curvus TaxID=2873595 RepID=UPI001CCD00C7|nr:GAF domain-containing protein [Psychroflexus curvus]MBZ9787610.1 GAF domain-containing protein [Psychroflexus curvus]